VDFGDAINVLHKFILPSQNGIEFCIGLIIIALAIFVLLPVNLGF